MVNVSPMSNRRNIWHDHKQLEADLADLADNSPDHHTAAVAARALALLSWQSNVIEELKGTVATVEYWRSRTV